MRCTLHNSVMYLKDMNDVSRYNFAVLGTKASDEASKHC